MSKPVPKIFDLTGQKYHMLTVLEYSHTKVHRYWKVKCECGNIKTVSSNNLKRGRTKSCGCLIITQGRPRVPDYNYHLNSLYSKYHWESAESRKLIFDLTLKQFEQLTSDNCFYCGISPYRQHKSKAHAGFYLYNGIDRVNNTIGYILENCVSCCLTCNRAKHAQTQEEFSQWLKRLMDYQNVKTSSN